MNEGRPTPQQNSATPPINTGIPAPDSHPLHMLYDQADPESRPRVMLQKPIRTYESDMAEILANKNTNIASMVIAEQKRRFAPKPTPPKPTPTKAPQQSEPQQAVPVAIETRAPIQSNTVTDNIIPTPQKSIPPSEPMLTPQVQNEKIIEEENEKPRGNFGKKLFMFLLSMIFIACGLGGGYYLYTKSPLAVQRPPAPIAKVPSLINADKQKLFPVGKSVAEPLAQKIQQALSNETLSNQSVLQLIPVSSTGSSTLRISPQELIKLLGYNSPDMLNRSLINEWAIGSYANSESKDNFIIFKTDFFQNAFAGMLRWEFSMPDELATLLDYKEKIRIQNTNSSSSIASYFTVKGSFQDRVVLNRDVREFITDGGLTLVLYSFIDKDTLIITTSETTLKSLIEKLEKQTYIR